MLFTDKYTDNIYDTPICYERTIIQGCIPSQNHAEDMTGYLYANNNTRIFDFLNFSQPLSEQARQNAQKIADESGIEIEFIRKLRDLRKNDRIQDIISKIGKSEGLVHTFSAMEQCNVFQFFISLQVSPIHSTHAKYTLSFPYQCLFHIASSLLDATIF